MINTCLAEYPRFITSQLDKQIMREIISSANPRTSERERRAASEKASLASHVDVVDEASIFLDVGEALFRLAAHQLFDQLRRRLGFLGFALFFRRG